MAATSGLAGAVGRARSGRRVGVFLLVYLLLTVAIGWRLVTVQVVAAEEYRAAAEQQATREVTLPAERGTIYDRGGEPLAISVPASTVYANPRLLDDAEIDPTYVAADLEPLLDIDLATLMERLTADSGFVYLGRQLPRAVGEQVAAMRLPGIGVVDEPRRRYPAGPLAAQVVGFAGLDGEGLSGLEAALEADLAGEPGLLRQERAPGGVEISASPRQVEPSVPGQDVVLTLDRPIQDAAERLLAEAVEEHDAIGASAVVLDVDSGEILAMASQPGYDPADIGQASAYERRNRAVTDVFEPGSVNKAITLAAAIEEGVVDPADTLEVPTTITVGGKAFSDATARAAGPLTVEEVMARSSNVGTIQIAERLDDDALLEHLGGFGLGAPSGADFPGESGGIVPALEGWSATTKPTIAIGQGVSGTLLQTAGVFQTIANGGERVEPRIVRGRVDDGALVAAPDAPGHEAISAGTAEAVRDLLVAVVEDGTGQAGAVPGYRVAGKTGTAQKASATSRGYEPGAYIATFAGFAPAEDPSVAIAVMVDEPEGEGYGGVVAAPLFADLMDVALARRRVTPTDATERGPVAASEDDADGVSDEDEPPPEEAVEGLGGPPTDEGG
ncbi:MAG: peptidoglycan D,D-transpeptidase FtsI family protein [Actinomycetota bacterium]